MKCTGRVFSTAHPPMNSNQINLSVEYPESSFCQCGYGTRCPDFMAHSGTEHNQCSFCDLASPTTHVAFRSPILCGHSLVGRTEPTVVPYVDEFTILQSSDPFNASFNAPQAGVQPLTQEGFDCGSHEGGFTADVVNRYPAEGSYINPVGIGGCDQGFPGLTSGAPEQIADPFKVLTAYWDNSKSLFDPGEAMEWRSVRGANVDPDMQDTDSPLEPTFDVSSTIIGLRAGLPLSSRTVIEVEQNRTSREVGPGITEPGRGLGGKISKRRG
ncbi:hypothetical protein BXZ70DRAFT_929516 [Cristinia sonorae]|uniref:Uncharacterized protein n=1 Tax=Cristinia sonorae TaxID=1940300 RepID=A0A8K0UT08_9AGAR|nr:hypothetical protein BXZ70DRAFT_929516 [Cristinia sonorae]